ncbi:hypothetical protein NX059_001257 [Plenodomus lindquistii]|nr:hypothetical protein NX059_001257 [Plenodomus lindquistii]
MIKSSLTTLIVVGVSFHGDTTAASSFFKPSFSPTYRNANACPDRCSNTGPNTGNWSAYSNFKQLKGCKETLFYDFSLYDEVDDQSTGHGIRACSSFGPDFSEIPSEEPNATMTAPEAIDVQFQVGWWDHGHGLAASGARSVVRQMRKYINHGHGVTDRPLIMFGQSGQAAIGLYIGQGLLNKGFAPALKVFEDNLANLNVSTPSLAVQLCGPEYDSTHIFGMVLTSNATFSPIQNAIKQWNNASCLSFSGSTSLTGQATFATPLSALNGTSNSTISSDGTAAGVSKRHNKHIGFHSRHSHLHARAECKTVQVQSGDSCAGLAKKCGISAADFTKYNPASDFCAKLMPKQHVCCSSGTMPSFSPKPNSDGSCSTYQVVTDDNCDNLAAEYSLTKQDIEDFNKNTWGWNGCKLLFVGTNMCLSKGTPPLPASVSNAVCGPLKPGSKPPPSGSDIADLNPCPLNACCNIWGQCGITKDFCVDTNTGAPGTAKPGTFGCISNCGTDVVKGDGNGAMKIGYFEGYSLSRDCLFQDASQIDVTQYTHIHFAFGTLTPSFEVEVGDALSTYNFEEFKKITGVKKILSFGGWAFSAEPATYNIFRSGVTSANRLKMATNIANFIKKHELDGADIDWEYPGAPDIPGIPPASKDDGPNYLAFLVVLKNLLSSSKSVSIAAPSSYWYLKQYPLRDIGKVVDYIVFMTYDLHGQWDTDNSYSQEGCANGNCLRSQVNLTETKQSLAMITKAGVPGKKVIVGITSYGRSYNMAAAGCWGPACLYTGGRESSDAMPGKCTNTAGYIADAEIAEIISGSKRAGRVVKSFVDTTSNSDILVYDDTQWVSYMSSATKKTRTSLYSAWGMGGTTDWATDLQKYNDVPAPAKDWASFKLMIKTGENPKNDHTRNGNWTSFDCMNEYVDNAIDYPADVKWQKLGADAAWKDIVRIWKDTDSKRTPKISFSHSVSNTLKLSSNLECGSLSKDTCTGSASCDKGMDGPDSGPAAELIWDSFLAIHNLHTDYHASLYRAATTISYQVDSMEDTFAPIPDVDDTRWKYLLIDLVTLGTLSAAGPFFNSVLKNSAYFAEKALDNAKDTTMTLIGQSTTMAKDLYEGKEDDWTAESQNTFSAFMGQSIDGWGNMSSTRLSTLFNGEEENIEALYDIISDGKLTGGQSKGNIDEDGAPATKDHEPELRANIGRTIFAWSIPNLWRNSKAYAFVMDSGYGCTGNEGLEEYVEADVMKATGACIDGKAYFLVQPDGDARTCKCHYYDNSHCENVCTTGTFAAPPGLNALNGKDFGGITREDLIKGSVRTWEQNGKNNGGSTPDPKDSGTIDNLLKSDITTPGFVRLPVCSPERAFQSWDTTKKGSSDNYPCDNPPGKSNCEDSDFENQTSDASPKVEDCLQIIKNIEGDGSTDWTTDVVGKNQREIASHASCAFGVEATEVNGNVNFVVGGQDVIDIINDAVKQFGGDGQVGAKGTMKCDGNIKSQGVKWGIYHN